MIHIGDQFPAFGLESVDSQNNINTAHSSAYVDKWSVFYFYPKDFTFICPTEIQQMDKLVDEGVAVLGFSGDNEFCKLNWKETNDLIKDIRHSLVADTGLTLSDELGIVDEENHVCYRATFIVDPKNYIQHISVNALDTGRNVDEVIRTVRALQSGGLTGCGWEVGNDFVI
jgi:peroxiredoxin (alkyl hydroperoxide reductase subunit C)